MRETRNLLGSMVGPAVIAALLLLVVAGPAAANKVDDRDRALSEASNAYDSGLQFAQSRMYDQAISSFEKAIQKYDAAQVINASLRRSLRKPMDPKHALAMMNMGVCNMQKGQDFHPRARRQIEDAAKQPEGRNNPLIWYNVMAIRTLMGDHLDALDALDRALDLGFDNFDALRTDEDLYELRRKPGWRKTLEKHGVFL